MAGEERRRLATDRLAWLRWGPYLSERAWATVGEDYSNDADPWRHHYPQATSPYERLVAVNADCTRWTGLVADLVLRKYRAGVPA